MIERQHWYTPFLESSFYDDVNTGFSSRLKSAGDTLGGTLGGIIEPAAQATASVLRPAAVIAVVGAAVYLFLKFRKQAA